MKRILSLLLSLVIMGSLIPTAFASSTPPYSLQYVKNIDGVKYVRYFDLEDIEAKEYSRTQRTLEVYDVLELFLSKGGSWSAIVEPFRKAFQDAGFKESINLDKNNQNEYWYGLNNEVFIIFGEKASQDILNESGLVYISHDHVTTLAAPDPEPSSPSSASKNMTAQEAAQALYKLGLFNGTGKDTNGNPNFDLDRAPTRHEAVTMLVRLLGKASEAENGTWSTPFTDVADWAKPYVGYAYTNGLTSGISATAYGGSQNVTASQYLTFVLRALGYQVGTDFQWDRAWELSDKIGLTNGRYNATSSFTRGDIAIISYTALDTQYKGGNTTLRQILPSTPQPTPQNNIPDDACTSLKAAGIKTQISYRVIIKCVEDATNASTTNEWAGNLAEAFRWIGDFKGYLLEVCQLCGNYDNTREIKISATKLYDAIQAIPTAPSSAEGVFTERQLTYVKQIIAVFANQPSLWNDYNNAVIQFSTSSENT